MMTGKEKLYFLLIHIDDARTLAPSGQPLFIDPTNDLNRHYREIELSQLFTKLEKDEKVLRVLKAPKRINTELDEYDPYEHADDGCWHIELLPAFDKYFLKIQQEPEYQEYTGKKPTAVEAGSKPQQDQDGALPKYSRKALEKIWNVLQEIEEKRQLSPSDGWIELPFVPSGFQGNEHTLNSVFDERETVLKKLESLGAISQLDNNGEMNALKGWWNFSLGKNYQNIFDEHKREYEKVVEDYQKSKQTEEAKTENPVYEIKYSEKTREILVNGFFLAKPDFNRENEIVFTYIYSHPNERISRERIEKTGKENDVEIKKPLSKIIENLGFAGNLQKAFFSVSNKGILFRNPVTRKDLDELGIKYLPLK